MKKRELFPSGAAQLKQGDPLGAVAQTGVSQNFQDWDATVLSAGCAVFQSGRNNILPAEADNCLVPY